MSKNHETQLSNLIEGVEKAYRNAEDLFQEASILYAHGALCRALFLHQISLEECGKIEMLGAWATSLLSGFEVDIRKVTAALASHRAKNRANAYFLPVSDAERQARANADIPAAVAVFKGQQTDFHTESNLAKNSSLYVDFKDEEFIAPSERITEVMVRETASRNAEFLALTGPKVEMMLRWKSNPAEAEHIVKLFRNRLEQLRSDMPDDPEKAMSVLMEDLLSEVKTPVAAQKQ
jgi:AbiV family abortive infection protein